MDKKELLLVWGEVLGVFGKRKRFWERYVGM